MKKRNTLKTDKKEVKTLETPINNDSILNEVFDEWYEVFWRKELQGARLSNDLKLISRFGKLYPGNQIIDLACAFGRITNALAMRGYNVTGLDVSLPLLNSAREDALSKGLSVEYLHCEWRKISLAPIYDCALLWFTSFGYLSENDNLLVLERALSCLKSGGRLLIETRHWDKMQRQFEPTTVRISGDNFLIEFHEYEAQQGIQRTHQILLINGRRVEREYCLRRYTFAEMRTLCLRVGFKTVQGYDEIGNPLESDSQRCILVATK